MLKNSIGLFSCFAVFAALAGCAGRVDIDLKASGEAKVLMQAKLEDGVVRGVLDKVTAFTGEEAPSPDTPLFDAEALKDALKGRPEVKVESAETADPDSIRAAFTVADLPAMGKGADGTSPFFTLKSAKGQKTLGFRLDRNNVARLPELFPAFDPGLLEMLSPPSLFGDEIGVDEYRDGSLALFVGTKGLSSVDKSAAEIRITPPGKILSQTGGKTDGNTFTASLPLLTVLVLDEPYEFSLTWKE